MRRLTGKTITGEVQMVLVWKRLKEIEDILTGQGNDYDLERLKQLVTGDNFTDEDMSAAYTSGYESGRKQGEDKHCGPCPAIHAVKAMAASDLQAVVRCKDCVHSRERNEHERNYLVEDVLICTHPDCSDDCWFATWYDHWCRYGERRRTDD
jgi:hypothetical protein